MGKLVLHREPTGESVEIDEPVTSHVEPGKIREELGLPEYIDVSNTVVAQACVMLWHVMQSVAAGRKRESREPDCIPLLFGGCAVKMLSVTSNKHAHSLNRKINDLDFVVQHGRGGIALKLFKQTAVTAGNRFTCFETRSDELFNSLHFGERFRLHFLEAVHNGVVRTSRIDLISGKADFCHTVRFSDEDFSSPRASLYSVSPEKLALLKLQVISAHPSQSLEAVRAHSQSFRLLQWNPFSGKKVVLGMELKDALDVLALFVDSHLEDARAPRFSAEKFAKIIGHDKKLALTVRLNLKQIVGNNVFLESVGLSRSEIMLTEDTVEDVLKKLPAVDENWGKPWWNTDVESP
ncbi:MAG: hypothetical protein QW767_00765 [Thermoprotei archaeon]